MSILQLNREWRVDKWSNLGVNHFGQLLYALHFKNDFRIVDKMTLSH